MEDGLQKICNAKTILYFLSLEKMKGNWVWDALLFCSFFYPLYQVLHGIKIRFYTFWLPSPLSTFPTKTLRKIWVFDCVLSPPHPTKKKDPSTKHWKFDLLLTSVWADFELWQLGSNALIWMEMEFWHRMNCNFFMRSNCTGWNVWLKSLCFLRIYCAR